MPKVKSPLLHRPLLASEKLRGHYMYLIIFKCVLEFLLFFFFFFASPPRILQIHFLHTANNMQTVSTGSGKGRIIWRCSPTVRSPCKSERSSLLLKLRLDWFISATADKADNNLTVVTTESMFRAQCSRPKVTESLRKGVLRFTVSSRLLSAPE